MVKKEDILEVLKGYSSDKVMIATLGSHTALHILKGAKDQGFKTLVITKKGREVPYKNFGVADEFLFVEDFEELNSEKVQNILREKNAIIIPHGSFIAYVGLENLEEKFFVPIFGNRFILRWESERELERKILEKGGVRVPKKFKSPEEIDRTVMVKFPGARGGRGYFICQNKKDFLKKFEYFKKLGEIKEEDLEKVHIEEYLIGPNFCFHFFYSFLKKRVELLGIDKRYESNVDGLVRIPAREQMEIEVSPSYVITGNIPVVIRESLLPQVFTLAEGAIKGARELVPPGFIGPFCLQSICTENLELVVFEMSARIDGGTNSFMNGSPYSYILFGRPVSMGERIAMEIKEAIEKKALYKILS